ncbi:S-layer homology domain-containing protein [Pseudomonadota bacterium]
MKKFLILTLGIFLFYVSSVATFAQEIPPGGFDYNNDMYGFYLVMPAGWGDYSVEENVFDDGTTYQFFLPTTDTSGDYLDGKVDLFIILATTEPGPEMMDYIGENSVYQFYFSHLNGIPPDDLADRVLEFDQITSTFTAFEPTGAPGSSEIFSDIAGHAYEEAILFVQAEGVVEGYSDGTYRPDDPVNRAEFTKIFMEALYEGSSILGSNCFPDVGTEWFAKYVCSAETIGVIDGYPNGEFKPANYINLAESLKILTEISSNLNDVPIEPVEGEWYQVYFDMANDANLLDTINSEPGHLLTRGEMAELTQKISGL